MTFKDWQKTDYGYVERDTRFYKDDEWFGADGDGTAGNDGSMAWEWAAFLMEALSDMRTIFGVEHMWDFFHPSTYCLVNLANRCQIDSSIAAIGYHVQIVTPNDSFIKILIYKDGNPSPLQIVFYNEDKLIGVISPIPSPQYFNKQTHRRKGAKKLHSFLRKFPHTELLEASSFIDKAINRFVDSDKLQ